MKPDWDTLMDEFKDSKSALIADVDCTTEGKSLCEKHGVRGYPTIKWGDPSNLQEYNGGRTLADFKKHAEENLGPTCGPDNIDLCDDDTKALITKFQEMSEGDLTKAIVEADDKIAAMTAKTKKVVDGLEAQIKSVQDRITKEGERKDDELAKYNQKSGLRAMKSVSAAKKKAEQGTKKKSKKKGKKEL